MFDFRRRFVSGTTTEPDIMTTQTVISAIHVLAIDPDQANLSETLEILEQACSRLARDSEFRHELGTFNDPPLWPDLVSLWSKLSDAVSASEESQFEAGSVMRNLSQPLVRFTRNIVAAVSRNQLKAEAIEPWLRQSIFHLTSFYRMQDGDMVMLGRLCAQTLSNLTAANDDIQGRLWNVYMHSPEERNIILRLLGSPDARTKMATVVFILNCVRNSQSRALLLTSTPSGQLVCGGLLHLCETYLEAEIDTDEGQLFDASYHVFRHLFDGQMLQTMWRARTDQDECITPHQTTLLKLFDSYMQTGSAGDFSCSSEQVAFLVSTHLQFCNISRQSINSFLDSSSTDSDRTQTLDPRLPFIVEAIVLLSQCLITALLKEADGPGYESVKRVIITLESNDFIDILIDVLRLLDRFLPRINQGQPQFTTTQAQRPRLESDSTGFAYAKRDLVRLLGILSHEDRVVQDQIRKSGGIPVVMSLCVIDERNPYLREHALFALRNIIHRNDKNQKEVAEIRPLKDWDVEGVLQDLRT